MNVKKILTLALFLGITACSTNQVKQLDTSLDPKGNTNEGTLGLKDGEAIIQQKNQADLELKGVQWQNYDLENELGHEQSLVKWCYTDLADPRLGGSGEVTEMPELAVKPAVKVKEELGLEGENLIILKTTDFKEKLQAEKKYGQELSKLLTLAKQTREKCERKMGYARVKAGLPSQRYQGKITITPEGNVGEVLAPHENSLDDAFKIKKENRKPASKVIEKEQEEVIE